MALIVGAGIVWSLSFLPAGILDHALAARGVAAGRRRLAYVLVLWAGAVIAWLFLIEPTTRRFVIDASKEVCPMKTISRVLATLVVALPLAIPAHADDGIVLDYRNRQFRAAMPAANAADKARHHQRWPPSRATRRRRWARISSCWGRPRASSRKPATWSSSCCR